MLHSHPLQQEVTPAGTSVQNTDEMKDIFTETGAGAHLRPQLLTNKHTHGHLTSGPLDQNDTDCISIGMSNRVSGTHRIQ